MKKVKCSCGHSAEYHYISDADVSKGKVICHKDNCHGWDRCDLKPELVDANKAAKH
jgi:hypothetical protein